ncbi:MAG: glycosyltransferase family 4 protein [Betaproteobacteria bacterium]|nr:MAG: glycosyltransferase family 4 protein [Betaproteobacteria bacterium]
MKPLILNSEDHRGGAARAAYRLHLALRGIGVESSMLVQIRDGTDPFVIGPRTVFGNMAGRVRTALDLLPLVWSARGRAHDTFYPGWLPDSSSRRIKRLAPDLVHLHWITGGFVNVNSLRAYGVPLVWTLHDMWAFTGGCHYDDSCGRYLSACGRCPALASDRVEDVSTTGWRRKNDAYRDLALNIVTPSRWLAGLARSSPLLGHFPVHVIPNAIDIDTFRPIEKRVAREKLGLPVDRKIILFGALRATSEKRKGFHLLQPALKSISVSAAGRDAIAVVMGANRPDEPPDFGVQSNFLGTLAEDAALVLAYSAADVFVAPSTQENLSNSVLEAMACGTPVVAFDIGGMPDMIDHRVNGYLAKPFETGDLANGLQWAIEDASKAMALSERARQKIVTTSAAARVAGLHRSLYESLLK